MKNIVFSIISIAIIITLLVCVYIFLSQESDNIETPSSNTVLLNVVNTGETSTKFPTYTDEQILNRTLDNVTMTIKEGSLSKTSATVIIKDTNESPYWYGKSFKIDKKENGEWKTLEPITNSYGFEEIALGVNNEGVLELKQDWKNIYGELKPGEYRLVKEQYENGYKYFWVEFEIE